MTKGFLFFCPLIVVIAVAIIPASSQKAAAPENLAVVETTTNSITVSWEKPPLKSGEKLKGFRLNYRAAGEATDTKVTLKKSTFSHTVEDLSEGTTYILTIFAKTQNGFGRGSPELEVSTVSTVVEEPTVPGKPQYFEVFVTEQSVFARWLQPEEGEVTGYILGIGVDSTDEQEVQLDATAQTHTFDNLEPGRNYSLSLRAINEVGSSEVALQHAYVEQLTPDPPDQVTAVPSVDSIEISWGPAGDDIRSFIVGIGVDEMEEDTVEVNWDQNSFVFEDLSPGTLYLVSVRALNENGPSEPATDKVMTEVPQTPPPPVIDTVEATDNSVTVRWLPPSEPVTGYEVTLDPVGTATVGGDVTTYTFSNLDADSDYVLQLTALNDVGRSPPTEQLIQTEPLRPPQAPTFTNLEADSSSILVEWQLLDPSVVSYDLSLVGRDRIQLDAGETSHTFTSLEADTEYNIEIVAINLGGTSEPATTRIYTEPVSIPSTPVIESTSATSDSITVNWRRPTETNIYSYKISLDSGPPITLDPDEFSYTFRSLEPATEYLVTLLVTTDEGGISIPVTERLSTEPPQPLPKPTIRSVEATVDTIEIVWEEPSEPFISYELTLDGNDPITIGNQETSYTFYNLQPDTRYAVELRVINEGGPSSPARSRVSTEPVGIPSSPVIESNPVTSDSITVNWRRPTETNIYSYEISLDSGPPIILGPDEFSYTFRNLEPATEYLVTLLVTTNEGGISIPVTETLSTEPPDPLPKPTIRSVEATVDTIEIVWEEPSEPFISYELTLDRNDPITIGNQETSYTFYNLQPETRYAVELRVINQGGPSSPARSRVTTDAMPPTEPPIVEVQGDEYKVRDFEADVHGQRVILTWRPPTDYEDRTMLGYLLQIDAEAISLSTSLRLHYRQTSYTFRNLEPLIEYHAIMEPIRRDLATAPSEVRFTTYVSRFVPPRITAVEILTSRSARVSWMDPTVSPVTGPTDSRYYSLRYRPVQQRSSSNSLSSNYLYANTREYEHLVGDLTPDTEYEFSIQTIVEGVTSGYSDAVRNSTLSETDGRAPRLLTIVQLVMAFPNFIHATLNWLPPLERAEEVSGYNVQYSTVADPSELDWQNLPVEGPVMAATVPKLTTNITASFRIQAFFFSGVPLGPFSPITSFITPTSTEPGIEEGNCVSEIDSITRRITETRQRGGGVPPLGVALPFCDEYLRQFACPWPNLICTCIPRGTNIVAAVPNAKPNPGCGAVSEEPPCRKVYNRVMEAINEARNAGYMLMGANIPYCRDDGYYSSKQCGGSVCYCVNERGIPNGLEAPLWEAGSLNCR